MSDRGKLSYTCGHDGVTMMMMKKNKGQVFIILSIIIITTMIMLKTGLNISQIMENKRYLEAGLEQMQFQNIRDEALKTVQISYYNQSGMADNLDSFMVYARQVTDTKAMDLNGVVVTASYNHSTSPYGINITFLNLLGTTINHLNITFNTSSNITTSISDGSIVRVNFTGSYSSMDYTIKLFFNTSYTNKTDYMTIPFNTTKSKMTVLIDMSLKSYRSEQKELFNQTFVLI